VAIELDDVYAAAERIAALTFHTPLRPSEWLSSSDTNVFLKLETVQPTCSFKIRGACNAVQIAADGDVAHTRLVTASAGNHGRGIAYAAAMFDLPVVVYMDRKAPRAKIDAIRASGAEVRPCDSYDEAEREAKAFAAAGGGTFISPYSDAAVIAATGTIALELIADLPSLDAVVVPIGGGGLISGIGLALKALSPSTKVIGIEVEASCPFTKSLAAGRVVTIDVQPSLADGLTGNLDPDTITFDIVRRVVDEIVLVDEPGLRRALAGTVSNEHLVVEGAAAAGPAALLDGKVRVKGNVAVILTGANIDSGELARVLR
jgi:threonine dehydratase